MKWYLVVFMLLSLGRVCAQDTSGVVFTTIKPDTPVAAAKSPGKPTVPRILAIKSGRPESGWAIFLEGMAGVEGARRWLDRLL